MKIFLQFILIASMTFPQQSVSQEIPVEPLTTSTPKIWTFNAGIGSPKVWNIAGITREYLINEHTAFFVTAGFGTALIGTGMVYYGNREDDGIVISSAIGIVNLQATLAYQIKTGAQDFISVGGSYGMLFMQCYCWAPVLSYEHRY